MKDAIQPLKAEKFFAQVLKHYEDMKDSYIYGVITRDCREKTEMIDAGYARWLQQSLGFLCEKYRLRGKRILDIGCGMGELTVRMRTLGYEAYGLDLHKEHLRLATILAEENGLPPTLFILNSDNCEKKGRLPFEDRFFDIVTLFSSFEHISDSGLNGLLPEVHRVSRGVVYVLVPNRLKPIDDHTGLKFVNWMPRWMARLYIRAHGRRRQYRISRDGTWDVYNRTFGRVRTIVRNHGFDVDFIPDDFVFPLQSCSMISHIGKHLKFHGKTFLLGFPLPIKSMMKRGYPRQGFYRYLNLLLLPKRGP